MFRVHCRFVSLLLLSFLGICTAARADVDPLCEISSGYERPQAVPDFQFQSLPNRRSPDFAALVEAAKRQVSGTKSFAIVDLRAFVSPQVRAAWWLSLATGDEGRFLSQAFRPAPVVLGPHAQIIRDGASIEQVSGIDALRDWFSIFVRETLPFPTHSPWTVESVQIRAHAANGRGMREPYWHTSSDDVQIIFSLYGTNVEALGSVPPALRNRAAETGHVWPELLQRREHIVVPEGHAIIFFGREVQRPWEPTLWRNGDTQSPYVGIHLR